MKDLEIRGAGNLLGTEQSGHMILLDDNSTGDGLMTACQYLAAVVRSGKTLDEAAKVMQRFPQTLLNVAVANNEAKEAFKTNEAIQEAVKAAEAELGDNGRVLVRPSGTECLVRVTVEAGTQESADGIARRVADVVESELA